MSALYRSVWEERLEHLCQEYDEWCTRQDLPNVDAYELLSRQVTKEQQEWLQGFCERWEKIYGE
jgi:hypothetical protein